MPEKIETREIDVDALEYRAGSSDTDKQEYVDGLGIVFDREEEIYPGYFETISRSAFDKWMKGDRTIYSYFNHDHNQVLSSTRSTPPLVLEFTDKGVIFRSPIPTTSYGKDLIENLKRKNVRCASFSFSRKPGGWTDTIDEKGNLHRTLTDLELWEVGPVTNGAYKHAKSWKRDMESLIEEARASVGKETRGEDNAGSADTNKIEMRKKILSLYKKEF